MDVGLRIVGSGSNPEEISTLLGVQPTHTWRPGDRVEQSQVRRETTGWAINSDLKETAELDAHVKHVFTLLPSNLAEIGSERLAGFEVELSCAVYTTGEMPSLNLSPAALALLHRAGASLDIDIIMIEGKSS